MLNVDGQPSKYFVSPNTKTLLLSQVDEFDVGAYHCVLTSPVDQFTSDVAYLDVAPPTNDETESGDFQCSVVCVYMCVCVHSCACVCV